MCSSDLFPSHDKSKNSLSHLNSQRVAEQLFDTNVNCGQVAAIKMAQRVLGLKETGRWNLDLLNKLIEIKD